jgi:hypothetical protein
MLEKLKIKSINFVSRLSSWLPRDRDYHLCQWSYALHPYQQKPPNMIWKSQQLYCKTLKTQNSNIDISTTHHQFTTILFLRSQAWNIPALLPRWLFISYVLGPFTADTVPFRYRGASFEVNLSIFSDCYRFFRQNVFPTS